MKEPRWSPILTEGTQKSKRVSTIQSIAWFMMVTFGGMAMAQTNTHDVAAFQMHDIRTPCMDHVQTPNDINIEVKSMKTSALSKKEWQQLCDQHVDSFEDALDPQECPIAITGHQLRRFDPEDIHHRLNVQWLNGERTSLRSDAMMLQHPAMVADYTVAKKLTSKPAFEWVEDCMATQQDI